MSEDTQQIHVDGGTVAVQTDWTTVTEPLVAIVSAIATATGREPCDIPPAERSIDTDSLNALLDPAGHPKGLIDVTFQHAGLRISVEGDGLVEVTEA